VLTSIQEEYPKVPLVHICSVLSENLIAYAQVHSIGKCYCYNLNIKNLKQIHTSFIQIYISIPKTSELTVYHNIGNIYGVVLISLQCETI